MTFQEIKDAITLASEQEMILLQKLKLGEITTGEANEQHQILTFEIQVLESQYRTLQLTTQIDQAISME